MPKSKLQKQEMLRDLTEKIGKAKSIYFAKYVALGVKDNEQLRRDLKAENGEYYSAKKTLLDIALKDKKIEGLNVRSLEGQIAAIFAYGDEVMPAKIVDKFKEKNADKISFVGGILDNRFYNATEVETLAKLPGKTELYAQMVGSLNAPISGFVNVMAGNLRGLVTVLKAVEEKKA
jgi:large subunit ribosomal protein L10